MAVLLATPSPPLPSASLPGTGHVPPGARGRAGDPPEPPDTAGSREPSQRWVPAPCAPCPASASCCCSPPLTPSHPKQGGGKKINKKSTFPLDGNATSPRSSKCFRDQLSQDRFRCQDPPGAMAGQRASRALGESSSPPAPCASPVSKPGRVSNRSLQCWGFAEAGCESLRRAARRRSQLGTRPPRASPSPPRPGGAAKSLQTRLRCLLAPRHASHATFWGEFSHESASWQGNHAAPTGLPPALLLCHERFVEQLSPAAEQPATDVTHFFACIFCLYTQVSACPHPAGGGEGAPCSSRQLCLPRRVPTGQGPAAPPEAAPPRDEAVHPCRERALRWGTAMTGSFLASQMDRWTAELCSGHSPNPFLTLVTQGRGMPGAAHPCGRDVWKRQAQQPFCPGFTRAQRRGGRRGKAPESEKQPL